jgi:DNA polymerase III epsilon subunit-like protein
MRPLPRPLVVFDLEFTSWEGAMERRWSGPGEYREVVQIGAVRLETDLRLGERLDVLCRPRLNPVLSDYFTRLTGITQNKIEVEGTNFPVAFSRLSQMGTDDAIFVANGTDYQVLEANCGWWDIPFTLNERCRSASEPLSRAAGRQGHVISCELGKALDLNTTPHPAHDALGDALMVAEAIRRLWAENRIGHADLFGLPEGTRS